MQFSLDNEDQNYPHDGDIDMTAFMQNGSKEPPGLRDIVGPTLPPGHTNGMILKGGKIVAEWGDTSRVDMTFSATKSYMATMVGLAWGDGKIPDLDDPVVSARQRSGAMLLSVV